MLNNNVEIHNLGGGAVLFKNAIDIPQDEIIPYLQNRQQAYKKKNFTIGLNNLVSLNYRDITVI